VCLHLKTTEIEEEDDVDIAKPDQRLERFQVSQEEAGRRRSSGGI
jgi:hypothetical protein